jgi:hypothetical protein
VPLLAIVFFAGVYTLVTGRSPRRWLLREPAAFRIHYDEELAEALSRESGAPVPTGRFRSHPDPRVRYTFPPNVGQTWAGAMVRTDELGLRVRTGPPPAPGARTIVLLGDSVAFGTGVGDDATPAQRLEDELAAARGDDGSRDVICRTVAIPGWNWRNEVAFLEDHFEALEPSIVLCMPLGNDLSDTEQASGAGIRQAALDVSSSDPLLQVSLGRTQQCLVGCWMKVQRGELELTEAQIGPLVLDSDLGGESSRRLDAMADGLVGLAQRLAAHDVRFALVPLEEDEFFRSLQRRLLRLAPELPWIPLVTELRPEDRLENDPHPDAQTDRVLARWIAESLVDELHWVDGKLPPSSLPLEWAGRRAPRRTLAELDTMAATDRERLRDRLVDAIVPELGHGVQQVYGGLSPAGTVGPRLLAALPRTGGHLELELAPLPSCPTLYPLDVVVTVDGEPVGTLTVGGDAGSITRASLELPPPQPVHDACDPPFTIDVKLWPERYGTTSELGGLELGSCRLVRLARVDG